ncbi:C39 family peptidase [Mycobacterium sp. 050134]|uniref:C39 family peptidase n=1 Tax=Mycobacterium sp. 050134 TaxID=3096111 RepID=UPI002ED81901
MIGIRIARCVGTAVLAGASALTLAVNTAQAAPDPPAGEGTLYGDPAAAAPFWRYQQYDDDCVEMSVADVVGELTGHQPSEQAIVKVAQTTPSTVHPGPIYTKPKKRKPGSGTSFEDEPALLAHYGIHAVDTDTESAAKTGVPTGMRALQGDLAAGRKVIVAVNAEIIWREPVEDKSPDGEPESNHAVVVTGVDTTAGVVHLNDSGSEDGRDEQVPIDLFIRSWGTSDDEMTVTG